MRVFLLNPPTDEPVRTPLLALGYLAAALQRAGHAVGLLDASAVAAPQGHAAVAEHVAQFRPDLVGLHVKTLAAQDAWSMARSLRERLGPEVPLVAGGPHVTVVPGEALAHGCDFAIRGEAEYTLVELADALQAGMQPREIAGLGVADGQGGGHWGPERGFIQDLDALASPVAALPLFDPAWYGQTVPVAYGGVLASRGCPAACTFCCNNVTGRRFRQRSAAAIAAELAELRDQWQLRAFSFLDDSFAVGRARVAELSEHLAPLGLHWTCTAHPAHLDSEVLGAMQRAGCGGIDIGTESGDPGRLRAIGKGVTVDRTLAVVRACRERGLHVVVNLMFGWPGETERELDNTLQFMDKAAEAGAWFNARGVLVPFPGTEEYERHCQQFSFEQWWLRDPPLRYAAFPAAWNHAEVLRAYAADAALERNFFRHSDAHLQRIQLALERKASLTLAHVAQPAPAITVPAAGSR
ncbi:MAG: radical SAM protein [Deltaproteobacteria bacterium]|nr:radical SAM protein [Deltaproteobacteria bacterium]